MEPAILVALALSLFAATHVGLSTPRVRGALVARLGESGFLGAFFAVAALTFGVAMATYAAQRGAGAPGLALGAIPWLRWLLVGATLLGATLMSGALAGYGRTPYAMNPPDDPQPRGLERITRHPFFVGFALVGLSHALLATRMTGAVVMGGFGLFALLGAVAQDRKLTALRGDAYRDWLSRTSLLPFAAIVDGRQRLVWRELPWVGLGVGLALAFGLRAVHGSLFEHGGLYLTGSVVGGALLILAGDLHRGRRREPTDATPRVQTG